MSRERKRGTAAESAVVDAYRDAGFTHAERRASGGSNDRGDVAGIPGLVTEVKNHSALALAQWVDEAERERANDRADYGVVWHKRPRKGDPRDWYVTMTGDTWLRILQALHEVAE